MTGSNAVARMLIGGMACITAGACAAATASHAPRAAAAFSDADSILTTDIAGGVTHTFVRDARGPWAVHIVEIDAQICDPLLEVRAPGTTLDERAAASSLAADAIAGVNADFFMLPGGTPVGAHVTGGVPLIGPTDRAVFAATRNGWRIGTARMAGHARVGDDSVAIAQVNRRSASFSAYRGTHAGVTLFTSWIGDTVPADTAARSVHLRVIGGNEAAGRGIVLSTDSPAVSTRMMAGNAVLHAHGPASSWARRRTPGDTVGWSAQVEVDGVPAHEVVGGFPVLLRDGRVVLAGQTIAPAFGPRRHPRTAIGWTTDDRLLLVVVDGRQPPYSDGMALDELAWIFQRLGASDAINLDGGGSTAMVVNGRVVNRPSDREGERAVGNALVLAGCKPQSRP